MKQKKRKREEIIEKRKTGLEKEEEREGRASVGSSEAYISRCRSR
jgi:hypothetical protein